MRLVTQNVIKAVVKISDLIFSKIERGMVIFVGFTQNDNEQIVSLMAEKILNLRVFPDSNNKTNLNLGSYGGELMVIPNFTLYGDVSNGRRPSFTNAMNPIEATKLFSFFVNVLKEKYQKVQCGLFQADMKIEVINDGPFTMIIDSLDLEKK